MANLFLDANAFIDIAQRHRTYTLEGFTNHLIHISPLSVHILCYVYKYKLPQEKLTRLLQEVSLVPTTIPLVTLAAQGPTSDFEDNLQLHSAAQANCNVFLTSDEALLKMTFFGTMRLSQDLSGLR